MKEEDEEENTELLFCLWLEMHLGSSSSYYLIISSMQKLDQDTSSRYCDLVCPGWPLVHVISVYGLCLSPTLEGSSHASHGRRRGLRVVATHVHTQASHASTYTVAHSSTGARTRPRTAHSASGRESIHSPRQGRFTS